MTRAQADTRRSAAGGSARPPLVGRTLVRLAWLVPAARALVVVLPVSARRARLLLEFVGIGYDAYNRQGSIPKTAFSRDVEVYQAAEVLGTVGTFRGHDGLERIMGELFEAFAEVRFEPEGLREVGPRRIVIFVRFTAVGRGSGVRVDRRIAHVFELGGDGRVKRLEVYWDPEQAFG